MHTISKSFTFDSAHRLHAMECGHKCRNLHGHTYSITIHLSTEELDWRGMVVDYNELKCVKEWIDENLDHHVLIAEEDLDLKRAISTLGTRYLVLPLPQTTSELMAKHFASIFARILNEKLGNKFVASRDSEVWLDGSIPESSLIFVEVTVSETPTSTALYGPDSL